MTTAITLLVRDRPALTRQALLSLVAHTDWTKATLTVVDDASTEPTIGLLRDLSQRYNFTLWRNEESRGVGAARNRSVNVAVAKHGPPEMLYFSDNDVYFRAGWLDVLLAARALFPQFKVIGGYNHPYNQPGRATYPFEGACGLEYRLREHDAVGTASWLLGWDTWRRFGPFDETSRGINQSEDWAVCQAIRRAGSKVGAVWPHVVVNCGRTGTFGKPCPGAEYIEDQEGVVVE